MKIHEKIKLLRDNENWTQEEVAERLGMSINGYAKIERGETNLKIERLEQIAQLFGIDTFELMSIGEKNIVCLINENSTNNGLNFVGSSEEMALQLQHLQSTIIHKDELISQLKQEILSLKEIITLLKKN